MTEDATRPLGYGRYQDDPNHIGCPRENSDMSPCVARDGALAAAHDGVCVCCGVHPANLLKALVRYVTEPTKETGKDYVFTKAPSSPGRLDPFHQSPAELSMAARRKEAFDRVIRSRVEAELALRHYEAAFQRRLKTDKDIATWELDIQEVDRAVVAVFAEEGGPP